MVSNNYIFFSGANITSGGPLQIYRDFLNSFKGDSNKKIIAIVANKDLFPGCHNVQFIEIKNYKRFILLKFYYEYIKYLYISKKYNIDLWISLNDCTPTVKAAKRAVYCHNATPFYKKTSRDFIYPSRPFLQSFYYWIFYKINIKRNDFIIVQQGWFKDYFGKQFGVSMEKIIIHHPTVVDSKIHVSDAASGVFNFVYPTKPELYKNIEVIFQSILILRRLTSLKYQVIVTIKGDESRYATMLYDKYSHIQEIKWVGYQNREEMNSLYKNSSCLLFPSKLETWGLPLSEFKAYNKPIIAAELPYAKETVGDYPQVLFFDPDDPGELADKILIILKGEPIVSKLCINQPENIYTGYSRLLQFFYNYEKENDG